MDLSEAVKWFRKAAEQGDADSQNNLACALDEEGSPECVKEAAQWWYKAAMQGNALAQYNLAKCYADGKGIDRNYNMAVYWYRLAAEQGFGLAMEELSTIKFR